MNEGRRGTAVFWGGLCCAVQEDEGTSIGRARQVERNHADGSLLGKQHALVWQLTVLRVGDADAADAADADDGGDGGDGGGDDDDATAVGRLQCGIVCRCSLPFLAPQLPKCAACALRCSRGPCGFRTSVCRRMWQTEGGRQKSANVLNSPPTHRHPPRVRLLVHLLRSSLLVDDGDAGRPTLESFLPPFFFLSRGPLENSCLSSKRSCGTIGFSAWSL